MKEKGDFMNGFAGWRIFLYVWDDVNEPKGVVQIIHGMAEHAGRYRTLAAFLNSHGYIVYANDHRGQGKSVMPGKELGYVGNDGFNYTVEDADIITGMIKNSHPGLPVFIIAHSFGAFVGQEYITRYGSKIAGIILSGPAARSGIDVSFGRLLVLFQKIVTGEEKKSRLMNFLSFGSYNRRIKKPKSKFDWISRDGEEVLKYLNDPLCGTVYTVGFFHYMLKGLKKLYKPSKLALIPKKLPVFLLAGVEDPVGSYGGSVRKLYGMYKTAGLKNLKIKLYPGGRHEMINEVNHEEVFKDILEWLNRGWI